MYRQTLLLLALALLLTTAALAQAQDAPKPEPPTKPDPTPAATAPSPDQAATDSPEAEDTKPKIITVDRDAGLIDIKAKLVTCKPEWLELVATTDGPSGRSHESIVTVDTKPSLIHVALLSLGLEPGHPQKNTLVDDEVKTDPAQGPELELSFIYQKDGQTHEVPVHEWVVDAKTEKPIKPCKWMFTGSGFRTWQGKEYYMADQAGTIVSLVQFGDDLIARQTDTTNSNDGQQLQLRPDLPLALGDELVLRIKLPKPPPPEADTPQEAAPDTPADPPEKAPADTAPAQPTPDKSENHTPAEP